MCGLCVRAKCIVGVDARGALVSGGTLSNGYATNRNARIYTDRGDARRAR
jgi:hypothetical protein